VEQSGQQPLRGRREPRWNGRIFLHPGPFRGEPHAGAQRRAATLVRALGRTGRSDLMSTSIARMRALGRCLELRFRSAYTHAVLRAYSSEASAASSASTLGRFGLQWS
jgi:hypothetical protein